MAITQIKFAIMLLAEREEGKVRVGVMLRFSSTSNNIVSSPAKSIREDDLIVITSKKSFQ